MTRQFNFMRMLRTGACAGLAFISATGLARAEMSANELLKHYDTGGADGEPKVAKQ